jgi:hypothetical protein
MFVIEQCYSDSKRVEEYIFLYKPETDNPQISNVSLNNHDLYSEAAETTEEVKNLNRI